MALFSLSAQGSTLGECACTCITQDADNRHIFTRIIIKKSLSSNLVAYASRTLRYYLSSRTDHKKK